MPQEDPLEIPLKMFLSAIPGVSNCAGHEHRRSQQAGWEALALRATARRQGLRG